MTPTLVQVSNTLLNLLTLLVLLVIALRAVPARKTLEAILLRLDAIELGQAAAKDQATEDRNQP